MKKTTVLLMVVLNLMLISCKTQNTNLAGMEVIRTDTSIYRKEISPWSVENAVTPLTKSGKTENQYNQQTNKMISEQEDLLHWASRLIK